MDSTPSSLVVDGVNLEKLNYTVFVPYNGTIPTGGNSLTEDLNVHYNVRLLPSLHSGTRSRRVADGHIVIGR